MNLFEKIKKRKQRDNSYLFDDGDELDKIKKPTKKANKEVFDTTGKSAVRDAKKYASGEYPKIGGGDRGTPKSKGSGAFTGGISTKTEIGNEKDFMRRNVAKSGLKIKGTTPIKINVDPKAAKTPTARQSEVAKKTNEFVQRIKKIKGTKTGKPISTGDIGFTAPDRKTKVAKRTTRAVKQGLPDPFDIDTSKASKEVAKDLKVPKKSDFKKLNQRPGGYRAPVSEFGKSVTPSEFRSKQLSASAFRKTQPRDVKLPKSFTDFSKKLKTLKTDVAKTSSSTPRTVTKKYKPTTPVKQSEVSKKAQEFTTNINQKRQTTTPSKSDVERIKQNKIETKKAEAFKKTAAYRNIVKGTDAQGNYLTPEQRKAKFIKQTKQNKKIKNTTLKPRKDKGTYKTSTGDNRVTTGRGRGVGSGTRVTSNKDFTTLMNNNKIKNTTTGKKKVDLPKFGKKSGVTNPSFMKKVMPKFKKAATPAAKAFSKAGPVGKLAAAALVAGGAIYGGNQIRKAFAGAGKPKTLPAVKGSALRYTSGTKKGQKKYFDIKTMKKDYFTKSDFRDSKGNIDAGFGKPDRDEKLIKRLKSTK